MGDPASESQPGATRMGRDEPGGYSDTAFSLTRPPAARGCTNSLGGTKIPLGCWTSAPAFRCATEALGVLERVPEVPDVPKGLYFLAGSSSGLVQCRAPQKPTLFGMNYSK